MVETLISNVAAEVEMYFTLPWAPTSIVPFDKLHGFVAKRTYGKLVSLTSPRATKCSVVGVPYWTVVSLIDKSVGVEVQPEIVIMSKTSTNMVVVES